MNAPHYCRAFLTLLLTAMNVYASGYEEIQPREKVVARVELNRMEVSLADTLTVVVSVEGPAPLAVEPIATLTMSSLWQVRSTSPQTKPLDGGRERWQQTFHLEPLQLMEEPLQLTPLRVGEHTLAWKPIPLVVTTLITNAELSEARDITPIERLPAPSRTIWVLGGALAVVIAGCVGLVSWQRRRRRGVRTPPPPPDQWALRELERLEGLNVSVPKDSEHFYVGLADVIRRYLELRFDLRASEQTTAEFLETIQRTGLFPQAWQEQLRDLLRQCDLAKFARVHYARHECRGASQSARELIVQSTTLTPPPNAPSDRASQIR
jgi:hypothetical protein